ncbi:TIGR01777 family protein [Blastococcus sp. MG754426]|uniref:TIGR01777 family oxidoreductase n=1 Tax=unclassified Blastococcus TaxID=2619396 RepID=UPI001EF08BFE|nr:MULTISPECIES: TIGR01777 family oxidoreductase [unclassified Blastococcus]MCF6507010.1 TIGR01777 family protein [Blastococcus sp. MG754426]MCF6510961.1 TIGR01777 family protein [Blastococcus sp. MG754427]
MKIAVSGGSGMIGSALLPALRADGHEVIQLVRRTPRTADEHRWDPQHRRIDPALLRDVDAVVNLSGVGVGDRRWNERHKQAVLSSRVDSTATLAEALAEAATADPDRPRVLLNGSAVGWYGDTGDRVVDESAPPGDDYLARVCVAWEGATAPAADAGVRVTTLRTGLVLGRGGLLARMLPIFRAGLGGRLGSGRQYVPWISQEDEVGAIRFLLTHPVPGPVNLCGPEPVTNAEFTGTLGRVLHRPVMLPVPGPALWVVLGEFAQVGVLAGQRAVPSKLTEAGYRFTHGDVEAAVRAAVGRG